MHEGNRELFRRIAELEAKLDRLEKPRGVGATLQRLRVMTPWLRAAVVTTALAIPLAAYASTLSVPNLFVNGTVADADQVNANFAAVETAVNDNDARITTVEGLLPSAGGITGVTAGSGLTGGGLSGDVVLAVDPTQTQTRVSGACLAGSSIRAVGSDGSVTCELDDVGGGDITGVSAGNGLAGGGTAGDVLLSIAPSGVTSSLILDGTITASDISAVTAPTFGGITVNGATAINGLLTVTGGQDIRIRDNYNALRWYDDTGVTLFASFLIRDQDKVFRDENRSRDLLFSNVNGIGIGTSAPVANAAVTVPSLDVQGTLYAGYERVAASYNLSSGALCHSHGNLTCYFGSGSAVCPVGKRVLGGGSDGSPTARYGSISSSYPSGTDRWTCASSYDISSSADTCYAICARIDS